jgi:hypothetical protein
MKATFTKKIQIKSATAYLVFEKEQERRDIQDFLNGKEFEDEIINNRVKEYLRNLRIIDENDISTQKGSRIRQTGKMLVREEGKYKIWFTENDNFLETKILHFERIAPQNDSKVGILNIDFQEENYFLPINDNEFSDLKLIINDQIAGQINNTNDTISLSWIWGSLEKSHYKFDGQINQNKIKQHSINPAIDLNEFIIEIFQAWDNKQNRLKIQFQDLSDQSKITFEEKNYSSKWKDFDIKIENLPIMPYNDEDAFRWRNWLVEQELKEKYYLKYDFENLIKSINRKEGFSAYSNLLDIPEIEEYRNEIFDKDRPKQSPAFWHLTAANDLNPDINVKYSEKTLDYPVGKQITFVEISNELKNNTNHQINAVFYYDKYVYTHNQQNAMKAFFDCFGCHTKILITDNSQTRSNFLQKNESDIKQHFINQVFSKDKPQHNRYVVLCENKQKYTVWQIPSSIDFIQFTDKFIKPNSIGAIKDSSSYNRVKIEMLKPELRTFIESKI